MQGVVNDILSLDFKSNAITVDEINDFYKRGATFECNAGVFIGFWYNGEFTRLQEENYEIQNNKCV